MKHGNMESLFDTRWVYFMKTPFLDLLNTHFRSTNTFLRPPRPTTWFLCVVEWPEASLERLFWLKRASVCSCWPSRACSGRPLDLFKTSFFDDLFASLPHLHFRSNMFYCGYGWIERPWQFLRQAISNEGRLPRPYRYHFSRQEPSLRVCRTNQKWDWRLRSKVSLTLLISLSFSRSAS